MTDGKFWQIDQYGERSGIEAFIRNIRGVCERHGITIGHEDVGGAFILSTWDGDSGLQYAHLDDLLKSRTEPANAVTDDQSYEEGNPLVKYDDGWWRGCSDARAGRPKVNPYPQGSAERGAYYDGYDEAQKETAAGKSEELALLEFRISKVRDEVIALKVAWKKKESELNSLEVQRNEMLSPEAVKA